MTGSPGQPTPFAGYDGPLVDELDLSRLQPGMREVVRAFHIQYDRETRLLAEKLTFPRVRNAERRHIERELGDWYDTRTRFMNVAMQYATPPQDVPGQGADDPAGDDGESSGDAIG